MLFHLGFWISRPGTTPFRVSGGQISFPSLAPFISFGRIGVEIFFVLSGFVIAYSAQRATTASFLRGRILRLVPAAWVCATITLAFVLAYGHDDAIASVSAWVRSVAFIPYGAYIDGVYWTLGIEVAFYGLMLVLIRLDAMRHVDRVFLVLAMVSTLFCVTIFIIEPRLHTLAGDRTLRLALMVNGAQFAVGVFLWQLLYKGMTPLRLTGLAIGLIGGGLETARFVTEQHDRVLALVLWLCAVAAIVASVRWNARISALLGVRGRTLMRGAGLATYPLYLLHQVIGAAVIGSLARAGVPPAIGLVIVVTTLTAAAWSVAVHVEPLIRRHVMPFITGWSNKRDGEEDGHGGRAAR